MFRMAFVPVCLRQDHLNVLSVTRHILQLEGFPCETLSGKSRSHCALRFSDSKAGKLHEAIKQKNIVLENWHYHPYIETSNSINWNASEKLEDTIT